MKYILGNGISGLIWKFYNPEFTLIGPTLLNTNTGKPKADPFMRSYMIWLHDTPQTRQLLIDLGWKTPEKYIKRSRIGYYDNGVIRDRLTETLKKILVNKKMNPWDAEIDHYAKSDKLQESARLSLTGQSDSNFMNVIDIDHGEILYRLRNRTTQRDAYVGVIRDDVIGITNEPPSQASEYVYEKYGQLISTVPAPLFNRALEPQVDQKFESLPITFAVTRKKPKDFDGDYEMVYYDESVPFTRISHLNNKYCIEFTGQLTREKFIEMYPEMTSYLFDFWTIPQGRVKSKKLEAPKNIIFSGRFAEWDHSITTEHVIKQALDFKEVSNGRQFRPS